MIIACQKRRENLAEYLLYMWQIEDLIRAFNFSLPKIKTEIISQFQQPEEIKKQIAEWYHQMIVSMKEEGTEKEGHLRFLNNLMDEFHDFHIRLLASVRERQYKELYQNAGPAIQELAAKSPSRKMNDIELCLTGLYGLLMLRLSKKEITPETITGMKNISTMIAFLSDRFKKYEAGEIEI